MVSFVVLRHPVTTTCKAKATFMNDAAQVWNIAPESIRNAKTLWAAKKAIKTFCKHCLCERQ